MTEQEWFSSDWPDDLLEHVCSLRRTALGMKDSWEQEGSDYLPRVYPRKRRLFIAACCRHIWKLLAPGARDAIEVAERFADGDASEADRIAAVAQVEAAGIAFGQQRRESDPLWLAGRDALKAAGGAVLPFTDVGYCRTSHWVGPGNPPFLDGDHYDGGFGWTVCHAINALVVAEDPGMARLVGVRWDYLHPKLIAEEGLPVIGTRWYTEVLAQCNLVRDIFGNPFRPVVLAPAWQTANVVGLAQTIYDERAFDRMPILGDALEDAGCTNADILNHCRQPGEHVRGCWVVDLLLGKK